MPYRQIIPIFHPRFIEWYVEVVTLASPGPDVVEIGLSQVRPEGPVLVAVD